MKLPHPFYKFPLRFDVQRLVQEVGAFPEEAWCRHPTNFKGNTFLPLVATRGTDFDEFEPPMVPTPFLERSPYIRQVLGEFRTLIGRTRLMRLEPHCGVPSHFDSRQYWRSHTRVHIPIVTDPEIRFRCEDESVHMAAGEAWTFDNWRTHEVVNDTATRRIHLTMDTYGSTEFWEMAKPWNQEAAAPRMVPYREAAGAALLYETFAGDPVMSPAELDLELTALTADAEAHPGNPAPALEQLRAFARNLRNEWRIVWHLKGPTEEGFADFAPLAKWAQATGGALAPDLKMASNGNMLAPALAHTLRALIKPELAVRQRPRALVAEPRFDRPVFVVSAPRAGSTWLYELLAQNESFQTLGGEGHQHVESIEALQPRRRGFHSNRLEAADVTTEISARLRANYLATLRDSTGRPLQEQSTKPQALRFLEKTPKNALRIPFLKTIFPDAKFVFLHRNPRGNISAIIEAWRSGRFVTYPQLPGWRGLPWSLLLIPEWQSLIGAGLEEIALRQWRDANEIVMNDLAAMPGRDWCSVGYEELKGATEATLHRLCDFMQVPFTETMRAASASGRLSRYTLTPPDPQKWRKNEAAIESVFGRAQATAERLRALAPASLETVP